MEENAHFDIRLAIRSGLIAGFVSLSLSVIGMVELFAKRDLISGMLTMGQVFLFIAPILFGYTLAKRAPAGHALESILYGFVTGLFAAIPLIILIFLGTAINLREYLPNVSPALLNILTFGQGAAIGSLILMLTTAILSALAAGLQLLPERFKKPVLNGIIGTLVVGVLSEVLVERIRSFFGYPFVRLLFDQDALKPWVAAVLFISIFGIAILWAQRGQSIKVRLTPDNPIQQRRMRRGGLIAGILALLILPFLLGTYLSEVTNNVLIYVLMGFGLNIVVGFAGLLDLGYVAFFAVGAYVVALLTSTSSLGVAGTSFWLAIPVAVLVAVLFGVTLGVPVLRMRGDYLAIVTLGFGEIIRILALSDLLKPYIGGAQGILQIPKPAVVGVPLIRPDQFYYVVLAGCLLAAFVSWRLSESRLGRQWMAMREDEDVAEAMGINLVGTKLLAFGIGAAFSGLSGAIFASKLTSIFPHSFNLLVSINVLCLIIVGGMGSLPGVVVGSLILVGLPELLREFAEYRLLAYGALLIVMMLAKPEGFWPSAARKRELHADWETEPDLNEIIVEPESL